jgi:hypothetical protein
MDPLLLLDPCFKEYTIETILGWIELAHHGLFDADDLNFMQKDLITTLEVFVEGEYQRIGQKHNTVTQSGIAFIQAMEEIFYKFQHKEDVDKWHVETLDNCWREFQSVIGWGKALDDAKHRQTQSDRAKKSRGGTIQRLLDRLIKQDPERTKAKELWPHLFSMLNAEDQVEELRKAPDYKEKRDKTWEYIWFEYNWKKGVEIKEEKSYKFSSFTAQLSVKRRKLSQ